MSWPRIRGVLNATIIVAGFVAILVIAFRAGSQTLPCRTHFECVEAREVLRERLYDRGESSMLFELRRYERGDVDRRQVEEIMRGWDSQRSRGGYPCMPHEARCRE